MIYNPKQFIAASQRLKNSTMQPLSPLIEGKIKRKVNK